MESFDNTWPVLLRLNADLACECVVELPGEPTGLSSTGAGAIVTGTSPPNPDTLTDVYVHTYDDACQPLTSDRIGLELAEAGGDVVLGPGGEFGVTFKSNLQSTPAFAMGHGTLGSGEVTLTQGFNAYGEGVGDGHVAWPTNGGVVAWSDFSGSVDFLDQTAADGGPLGDLYVLQLDPPSGEVEKRVYTAVGRQVARDIAAGPAGSLRLLGQHESAFSIEGSLVEHLAGVDSFVAAADPQGRELAWVTILSGPGPILGHQLDVSPEGHTYIVGRYNAAGLQIGEVDLGPSDQTDWFVAKLE